MFAYSNNYIKVFVYDENGNPVAINAGTPIATGSSGFIVFGVDDGGFATAFSLDSNGSLSIQNPPNLDVPLSTLLITRNGQPGLNTEHPLLLEEVKNINKQLVKIVKHLESITEEEWDHYDDN